MFPSFSAFSDKSLSELVELQKYYEQRIQQARSEIEGEYAFAIYVRIQRRINELVDKSSAGTFRSTLCR